jgi:hypothetical protein
VLILKCLAASVAMEDILDANKDAYALPGVFFFLQRHFYIVLYRDASVIYNSESIAATTTTTTTTTTTITSIWEQTK